MWCRAIEEERSMNLLVIGVTKVRGTFAYKVGSNERREKTAVNVGRYVQSQGEMHAEIW
jgi:hypothetical protein